MLILHCTAHLLFKYIRSGIIAMTKSAKIKGDIKPIGYLDSLFESFRKDMETASRSGFAFPSLFDGKTRVPLCDLTDKGDRFELHVEVPGIEKDRLDVKATSRSVEIAAEKSGKKEQKRKDYIYSELSKTSFYRKIPIPEEIVPSRIEAKMNNGVLVIKLPKKSPVRSHATKVEIK